MEVARGEDHAADTLAMGGVWIYREIRRRGANIAKRWRHSG